jgi:hypothetical protein
LEVDEIIETSRAKLSHATMGAFSNVMSDGNAAEVRCRCAYSIIYMTQFSDSHLRARPTNPHDLANQLKKSTPWRTSSSSMLKTPYAMHLPLHLNRTVHQRSASLLLSTVFTAQDQTPYSTSEQSTTVSTLMEEVLALPQPCNIKATLGRHRREY